MVELLQNADLSREARIMSTVLAIVVIIFAATAAVVLVVVDITVVVRRAEFLRVDDLDGPPFARRARHRLHHRRERSATELMRHVVKRVDALQLDWGEVAVNIPVVVQRALLLHGRAERDLVPVSKDGRLTSVYANPVDLWMRA